MQSSAMFHYYQFTSNVSSKIPLQKEKYSPEWIVENQSQQMHFFVTVIQRCIWMLLLSDSHYQIITVWETLFY